MEAKDKAVTYLENQTASLTDVYDLAIAAYALQLANSTQADDVWKKLDAAAVVKGLLFFSFITTHFKVSV